MAPESTGRQWRRTPTADDLRGILADHVKEEILVREGRKLKIDEDDTVIRRRLAQKMTFLLEDIIGLGEPTEAELRALYRARPDISRTLARVSFVQALFKGEQAEERARIELASLAERSDLLMTLTERAYTSPIWYTPGDKKG